jgi:hypothetical protein
MTGRAVFQNFSLGTPGKLALQISENQKLPKKQWVNSIL